MLNQEPTLNYKDKINFTQNNKEINNLQEKDIKQLFDF